jgi:hypothetical protein
VSMLALTRTRLHWMLRDTATSHTVTGGDEFSATPPRVAAGYGGFVEAVLSLGPVRALADALPGVLALALRPPVSVDAVATAAAGAGLLALSGVS